MKIGAVIIGRNEGERLLRCIESVLPRVDRAVYVDSGSRDGSAEAARRAGAEVVELAEGPFTAARGRDEGVKLLGKDSAAIEHILFIDGDCILDPGFIVAASAVLEAEPRVGAVCGRRREARVRDSFWSRVIDIDWDIAPGDVPYFGGDSLVRVAALHDAGGWPVELIAGEEPDLCFRMRDRGWSIRRLDLEMTRHDVAMTGFGAYWKRGIRSGHAYVEVALRRCRGSGRAWLRRAITILAYGLGLPVLALAGAFIHWSIPLAVGLLYARLAGSMVLSCRGKGRGWGLSIAYALLNTLGKAAGAWGIVRFMLLRLAGRRSRLIEYKGVARRAGGGERTRVSA